MTAIRGVPYYRQERDYWCGPAVLLMLTHAVRGMPPFLQRGAARMCGTTRKAGTTLPGLRRGARRAGLAIRDGRNKTFVQMQRVLRRGRPVIVLYREPDDNEQHLAVVTGLSPDTITLHDPWHGPNFSLSREEFLRRWKVWGRWKWMMWTV